MSYKRSKCRNDRLKKLYAETKNYYGLGVYYDKKKKRLIRCYISKRGRRRYYKRYSNKLVRREKVIGDYGYFKKVYDLWWNLY
jgi:hypothetical protein